MSEWEQSELEIMRGEFMNRLDLKVISDEDDADAFLTIERLNGKEVVPKKKERRQDDEEGLMHDWPW